MKKETIWQELDRFINSIKDEIRSKDQDNISIDFWLFKIERRINMLKKETNPKKTGDLMK